MKKINTLIIILCCLLLPSTLNAAKLNGNALSEMLDFISIDGIPGVSIANFGTPECDDGKEFCLMDGLSWSDMIGWIAWNGPGIEIDVVNNGGVFPEEHYPKMAYNGNLGGYSWSEKIGWIQLSACAGENDQASCDNTPYCQWTGNNYCDVNSNTQVTEAASQDALNWGVYVDLCEQKTNQPECESVLSNPYCNWNNNTCEFDSKNNPKGQPVRGNAWNKNLGWIKFAEEAGDPAFGGVFVNWMADETPPIINGYLEYAWIPNHSSIGTIKWEGFTQDIDSDIDVIKSDVDYVLDQNPGYTGCFSQGKNESAIITENGNLVDLQFPQIGLISSAVANGHCKYTLSGVIYNKQGVGNFFGLDAKQRAIDAGIDPIDPAPHEINVANSVLITLAGDYDPTTSGIFFDTEDVADGLSQNESLFLPRDIAGNPILNIPFTIEAEPTILPSQMVRNIYLSYNFDASAYYFDAINPVNNILSNDPPPLLIGQDQVTFPESTLIQYPKAGPDDNYYVSVGGYGLNVKGLSPTVNGNSLSMLSINLEINTQAGLSSLPAISTLAEPYDLIYDELLDGNDGLPLPFSYTFTPALEVIDGSLSEEEIPLGKPLEASYTVRNSSPDNNYEVNLFSLDHIFRFEDENQQVVPSLEINDLNIEPATDTEISRTDRNAGYTRYQLWQEANNNNITSLSDNAFHAGSSQFHDPLYDFDFDNDGVNADGQYETNGLPYVDPNLDPDDFEAPLPPLLIDRTDHWNETLNSSETKTYQLSFRPSLYLGEAPNGQVNFSIDQYVAYQANGKNPLSDYLTLYQAPTFISGMGMKTIGLGTDGVVSGGQVFESVSNRDLESITLTTSADLKKEMRRNVATMTRNMDLENCTTASVSPMLTLPTTPSDCVLVDEANKKIIAVYRGGTLTLGAGTPITIPNGYHYTLILDEGANLYLNEDMYYNDSLSTLGLIVLQDTEGNGGNVYLDPEPSNLVGYLYAEGSLLSSPDDTGDNLYYTTDGPAASELRNQLYWQGSIASRNTIGGAPGVVRPNGVDCALWPDAERCAQAHDLDFVRRFTVLFDAQNQVYYSTVGALFSGGGACIPATCSLGGFDTTITLINNFIDADNSKSLDPFYIERDNRPAPPGFTTETGYTSELDIR